MKNVSQTPGMVPVSAAMQAVAPSLAEDLELFYRTHPLSTLSVNGVPIHYICTKHRSETILLFHGAMGNAYTTYAIIQKYEAKYQVIAPSIDRMKSIDDMVAKIDAILDAEQVSRAIIRSGSFGSIVAQAYFHRRPHRVKALILANTYPPKVEWTSDYKRMVMLLRCIPPFLARKLVSMKLMKYFDHLPADLSLELQRKFAFQQLYYRELFHTVKKRTILCHSRLTYLWNLSDSDSPRDYSDWDGEVLILMGEQDGGYPYLSELAAPFPHPIIQTLKDEGHLAALTKEDIYNQVIEEFLQSVSP